MSTTTTTTTTATSNDFRSMDTSDLFRSVDLSILLLSADSIEAAAREPPASRPPARAAGCRAKSGDVIKFLFPTQDSIADYSFSSVDVATSTAAAAAVKSSDNDNSNKSNMHSLLLASQDSLSDWMSKDRGHLGPCNPSLFRSSCGARTSFTAASGKDPFMAMYETAMKNPSLGMMGMPMPPLKGPSEDAPQNQQQPSVTDEDVEMETKPKAKDTKPKNKRKRKDLAKKIFVERTDLDILCGRGGKSNNWEGNKRYRAYIEEMKADYQKCQKYEKTLMSQRVVEQMAEEGRRFIEYCPKEKGWYLVEELRARKKAGQALREENTPEFREKKRQKYKK